MFGVGREGGGVCSADVGWIERWLWRCVDCRTAVYAHTTLRARSGVRSVDRDAGFRGSARTSALCLLVTTVIIVPRRYLLWIMLTWRNVLVVVWRCHAFSSSPPPPPPPLLLPTRRLLRRCELTLIHGQDFRVSSRAGIFCFKYA